MSLSRPLVALLAIAFSLPAFAGDVDTHFDRARGREAQPKLIRTGPPNEPTLEVAQDATPPTPKEGESVALSATPRAGCTCTADTRAK